MSAGNCAIVDLVYSGKPLLTQILAKVAPGTVGWPWGKSTRAASSLNLAISVLLLTTNLEGKHEHTFAFKGNFISSHLLQMQRIYLGFFFGPWGGKVSLSWSAHKIYILHFTQTFLYYIYFIGKLGNLATAFRNDSGKKSLSKPRPYLIVK